MQKQADDLSAHTLGVMKMTLDLCEEICPSTPRNELQRVFVNTYFNAPESLKQN